MNPALRGVASEADWRALLADPERQWRPGFSAMATARSWLAGFPPEIAALLGPDATLLEAHPEHKVPMPGRGYPSQCDVFALCRADGNDIALAVEAKVSEPFGPTVAEWLGPAPSENKRERLGTICGWLGAAEAPGSLRYQLLHRTAAAIVEARRHGLRHAAMIVQSFSPERAWFEDFAAFCGWLGIPAAPGTAADRTLPDGIMLRLGWACGDPDHLKASA